VLALIQSCPESTCSGSLANRPRCRLQVWIHPHSHSVPSRESQQSVHHAGSLGQFAIGSDLLGHDCLGECWLLLRPSNDFHDGTMSASAPTSGCGNLVAAVLLLVRSLALILSRCGWRDRPEHAPRSPRHLHDTLLPGCFGLAGIAALWAELFSTRVVADWKFTGLNSAWDSHRSHVRLVRCAMLNNFRPTRHANSCAAPARFARWLPSHGQPWHRRLRVTNAPQPADRHRADRRGKSLMLEPRLAVVAGVIVSRLPTQFPAAWSCRLTQAMATTLFPVSYDSPDVRSGRECSPAFPRQSCPSKSNQLRLDQAAGMGELCWDSRGRKHCGMGWIDLGSRQRGTIRQRPEQVDSGHDWISASTGWTFRALIETAPFGRGATTRPLNWATVPAQMHPPVRSAQSGLAAVSCRRVHLGCEPTGRFGFGSDL